MSGLGVTSVIWLLIAVSFTASMCGYLGSAIAARRNNQRSRRSFALGFALWLDIRRSPASEVSPRNPRLPAGSIARKFS